QAGEYALEVPCHFRLATLPVGRGRHRRLVAGCPYGDQGLGAALLVVDHLRGWNSGRENAREELVAQILRVHQEAGDGERTVWRWLWPEDHIRLVLQLLIARDPVVVEVEGTSFLLR